jgi:hypothetical protein
MRLGVLLAASATACSAATGSDSAVVPAEQVESRSRAAQEILGHVNALYATAKTYRDEGTIRTTFHRPPGNPQSDSESTASFRTHWTAPDRVRFDFRETSVLHMRQPLLDGGGAVAEDTTMPEGDIVLWAHDGFAKTWFLGKVEAGSGPDPIDDQLWALQGVTGGATGLALRFLHDRVIRHFEGYELRGRSGCGTATCFELTRARGDGTMTILVDAGTYAVRGYSQDVVLTPDPSVDPPSLRGKVNTSPFEVKKTITIDPVFDGPVDPSSFDFTPPN